MNLEQFGSNQTILHVNGDSIFFSYETPVAACVKGRWIRTSKRWSVTTSKHINNYLGSVKAVEVPQSELDALIA